jgi:hypothetical protein
MNNTLSDGTYDAADGGSQKGGSSATAGGRPAEIAGEMAAAAMSGPSAPRPAPAGSGVHRLAQLTDRTEDAAVRLRLVQVYLTPRIDEFLRQARSLAITRDLDVTASAVVRHAMEQLMATTSPADLIELLGSPKRQSQPRRGRPRRLTGPRIF